MGRVGNVGGSMGEGERKECVRRGEGGWVCLGYNLSEVVRGGETKNNKIIGSNAQVMGQRPTKPPLCSIL